MARERYSSIFVPLDGTPFAEAAVRPAAEIASRSGGMLHLVSVAETKAGKEPVAMTLAPLPPEGVSRTVSRGEEIEARLREVAERIGDEWGCRTSFEIVKGDPSVKTLLTAAERANADLIVAATHSRGVIGQALLGSTSADLSRKADIPVLLIPSEDAEPDPASTPMQDKVERIAVALGEDTEATDAVVGNALTQALLWEASLLLIHAVPILPAPTMAQGAYEPVATDVLLETDQRSLQTAEDRMRRLISALSDFGIDAEAEVVQSSNVADTVLERAEENHADLLVVGRHERGVWERLWKGSDSRRIARQVRSVGLLVCPLGNGSA